MARLLLLLILIPSSLLTLAQGYHRTLVPGRSWDIFSCSSQTFPLPCQSGKRYFLKDTTVFIDGIEYHPLFHYRILSANTQVYYNPFYVDNTQEYVSSIWMREDTVNGRVYARNFNNPEKLVADYSSEVGDLSGPYDSNSFVLVTEVNEVMLLNGDTRKVVVLENEFYFIEGMGSSSGLMKIPMHAWGFWSEARCVMDGSEVLWNFHYSSPSSSGSTSTCIGTLSVNDLPALPSIAVFPNPAMDRSTMELPPVLGVGATLEVFSITGQRMLRQEQVPVTLHMDISGWPRGAYLYEVTYKDGQKSRGTLLAQ